MAWWEWVVLAYAVILVPWLAWDLWHHARCPACRAARQAMRERYPACHVSGSSHRATEPGRVVVTVFYSPPSPTVVRPEPYWLVAVVAGGEVEELPDDPESPYRILGRK